MKKNIITTLLLALTISFGFSSCEDMLTGDLDRHNEVDEIAADTLYSYWGVLKSLQGVAERYVILGEGRGDLIVPTDKVSDSISAIVNFYNNEMTKDGANRYLKIADYYHVINSCNAFLASADLTKKNAQGYSTFIQEYAQVASIRAWTYLQLVLTYGRVPYVDRPMLSTETIEDFWNSSEWATADNLADKKVVSDLEDLIARTDLRDIDYGYYGVNSNNRMAHSTQMLFPLGVVLGDIYLLKAKDGASGQSADYLKAAQYYYKYLNTEKAGPIRVGMSSSTGSYFATLMKDRRTDLTRINNSTWLNIFSTTPAPVTINSEVVTVIPGNKNRLWGYVLRGVNGIFGFTTDILVNPNAADTTSTAKVSININYDKNARELTSSKFYEELNKSQNFETYRGSDVNNVICYVVDGAGDSRFYISTATDREEGETEDTRYIIKQNAPQAYFSTSPRPIFRTTYPIIYRKGTIWLHYAEALNGAGFPGYAFAILKSGLCGNENWVPTGTEQYAAKTYKWYDNTEVTAGQDTTFYATDADLDKHVTIQYAATQGVDLTADGTTADDITAYATANADAIETYKTTNKANYRKSATSWENWLSDESANNIVCDHISRDEMSRAAASSCLNFGTEYLRGKQYQTYISIGETDYQKSLSPFPKSSNTNYAVTTGIHTRGCGMIKYNERALPAGETEGGTTFNYVDQINKMRDLYGETAAEKAPLTKEEIYDNSHMADVQKAISDLILDELALETAFEGNRFFDLLCHARFRSDANQLAKRVARRQGNANSDETLRAKLADPSNLTDPANSIWYFKLPK